MSVSPVTKGGVTRGRGLVSPTDANVREVVPSVEPQRPAWGSWFRSEGVGPRETTWLVDENVEGPRDQGDG